MSLETLSGLLREQPAVAARSRLLSRALLVRFVSIAGSSIGFYLPLAVMPRFANQHECDL